DRNLADLLHPRPLIRVQDDVDVPARSALRTEGRDDAARQARAEHAGDLARREAKIGRLLAIDIDHQLRITRDATVTDVRRTRCASHDRRYLVGKAGKHARVFALDAYRDA